MNKKIFLLGLFVILSTLSLNIKLGHLAGTKATFTLFDSFAPIAGQFLGTGIGLVAVIVMQLLNLIIHQTTHLDLGMLLRIIPTLFAVVYFSKKSKWNILVPLLAIILFVVHPIGRTVWFYSMFWLIPIVCYYFQDKLLARALGATFAAHAVGGVLWLYYFNLPKEVWLSLIPVVIVERLLFAAGIVLNVLLFKVILQFMNERTAHEVTEG
ncbi:MAG TPA: hypothetical protein VF974_08455 [Patescibacteria group bacterium]